MNVSEVMTRGAECAQPETTIREAAERMKDLDVGALPVCGADDRLAGMITDRDIVLRVVAEGLDPKSTRIRDAMTPDIVYCFEHQDVREAAAMMRDRQIRRLVVLNRDKRLSGIVSLGDLAVESHDEHLAAETLERISEPASPRRETVGAT